MTFALGIVSALVAPLSMVLGFVLWDNHWTGSPFALNLYKCNLAALGFTLVVACTTSAGSSGIMTLRNVGFLMLSSFLGILVGDWAWLEGMRLVGAKKVIVVDSLKPFMGAMLGHFLLNERMPRMGWLGLILTVGGVALVGLEHEETHNDETKKNHVDQESSLTSSKDETTGKKDILAQETDQLLPTTNHVSQTHPPPLKEKTSNAKNSSFAEQRQQRQQSTAELCYGLAVSFSNVIFHTFGALITKKYGAEMTTWEICWIRFGFAGIVMMVFSLALWIQQWTMKATTLTSSNLASSTPWYLLPHNASLSSWLSVSAGVAFVSFLQPALTNYALFQISLALLLTLESVGPLYSLPLTFLLQRETPTVRATVGAILAVAGIVLLSFYGSSNEATISG